jgi:hypothetical protein
VRIGLHWQFHYVNVLRRVGAPALELSEAEFNSKSVKELRDMLRSHGLPTENALEKRDLRQRLLDSGRVCLVNDNERPANSNDKNPGDNDSTINRAARSISTDDIICLPLRFSADELRAMRLSDIRILYRNLGLSMSGLLDLDDMKRNFIVL